MHVLHYLDELRLSAGGVVRAVLDLTAELAKSGAEVTLLTGDAVDAPPEWLVGTPGCPRVQTIDRSLTRLLRAKTAGPRLAELAADADVIHLHTPWDPFNPAIAAAASRAGTPYALSVHGMLDDWCLAHASWRKTLKKRVYLATHGRRLLEEAAFVHFTTSIEAEQSLKHAPAATPLVEPLVIDSSPFRKPIGPELARAEYATAFVDDGRPRLLFLGRLQAIKGLPTFIEALAALPEPPHLLIAGPSEEGHDAELAALAAAAGLTDRVHLLGMVKGDAKRSLYEAADAFVLPSHHENFGIALVEAMLCGMPVLTSRHVGIWPEVERLGGLVVDHGAAGFTAGLKQLLDELPERKQAAAMNRDAVFGWLDPQGVTKRYLAAYNAAYNAAIATEPRP